MLNKEAIAGKVLLVGILIFGFLLRVYNLNWDQGFHLHPDERAIVMHALPLELPKDIHEFFSPSSSLNPHFFPYGSFPLYLLKIAGYFAGHINPLFSSYEGINLVGRFFSALFDTGTAFLVFLLARKIFGEKVGIIASLLYALSVFPIQVSHFYAVDTPLTFFVIATLYRLIKLYENPSLSNSLFVGILFGLSLATKISAIILLSSLGFAIAIDFLFVFLKTPHRVKSWFPHIPRFLQRLILDGLSTTVFTFIVFIILEPYALIDFKTFLKHNLEHYQMTHNPFVFPYTLQYVGKIPYFYEVKNIFLWGLGPVLGFVALSGSLYVLFAAFKKRDKKLLIVLSFFIVYFLVVGSFAIGFMRYMLPLYPLFATFGAALLVKLLSIFSRKNLHIIFIIIFLILASSWTFSFIDIYNRPNTRFAASLWINQNILPGSTLAVEHWDDRLPMWGQERYRILTLNLYDPDTPEKWSVINQELEQADYIIIASDRLYVPLMKLSDCQKLPEYRCYPYTQNYYRRLFSEKEGFQKTAEFTSFPKIPFLNLQINDRGADESFTVYDHPKVMIFKKTAK